MSSLTKYIKGNASQGGELLPIFHSCSGLAGQSILHSDSLEARKCKVFKKELLYFFYGKPAYHIQTTGLPNTTMVYRCPVCFIVDIDKIKPYRIYPFDTGAYMAGLYNEFSIQANETELQQEYALGKKKENIQAYVKSFFLDNEHYLNGECAKHILGKQVVTEGSDSTRRVDETEPSIIKLLRMLNCDGEFVIDERSRTVEIVCDKGILISDAVEHVILPNNLLDDKYVKEFFDKNKSISYSTYCFRALTTPEYYYEAVIQKAIDYINNKRGRRA